METGITEMIVQMVLLLTIIIIAAKVSGEFFERYLKLPGLLGELIIGMIIGPFALGGIVFDFTLFYSHIEFSLFELGEGLFAPVSDQIPIPQVIYALAQIGVVILLFLVGLETNVDKFLSAGATSTVIALGGAILPFSFGYGATILLDGDVIHALFMGAIMTATSVGITARVLSDIKKIDTMESVTILGAAVIDDVIGIIILTIVIGVAETGSIMISDVVTTSILAVGFWLGLLFIGLRFSKQITAFLKSFKTTGAVLGMALALCFFASFLAETVGLAMIIGAYAMGLALSKTELSDTLHHEMYGLYHMLVPIFFVTMGMMVNFAAMGNALVLGIVITILAIVSKMVGCGVPALWGGFNRDGALRIGMGMVPRGEVALIVAGYAITAGAINMGIYGVAVLMTAVTTLIAPIALVPLFKNGRSGLSEKGKAKFKQDV